MKVIVTGGTGFLGAALVEALVRDGADVVVLSRRGDDGSGRAVRRVAWTPDGGVGPWAREVDGADAVVNLAGATIAKRWTAHRRALIRDSRVDATTSVAAAIRAARTPPRVLISGSGVDYYPADDAGTFDEASAPGEGFLPRVCVEWESAALEASNRCRVVLVRTGLVLGRGGGALPPMALPFRLFAGGRVGSGRQWMSWIHLDDWVGLVRQTLADDRAAGPVNAVSPTPVRSVEFTRALARALHRPHWLPAPAFALKLLFGEMADTLLLSGRRVAPARAEALGYRFTYVNLDAAFGAVLGS